MLENLACSLIHIESKEYQNSIVNIICKDSCLFETLKSAKRFECHGKLYSHRNSLPFSANKLSISIPFLFLKFYSEKNH